MRLSSLVAIFLRIGNLTFGGGDPTILALERELVERRSWLPRDVFVLAYGLARITPGTNMLAFAAAAAWALRGWPAALAAVACMTIPSAVLVVWLTAGYEHVSGNVLAMAAISGAVAAAVGMMAAGAWLLARPHLIRGTRLRAISIVIGSAILPLVFDIPPLQVLAVAAAVGFVWRTA